MQPTGARVARCSFQASLLLLLPIVVVCTLQSVSEDASCDSTLKHQESDTVSMLQGIGAVHVAAGRASMSKQQDFRPTAASSSTDQFDANFGGRAWADVTMPQRLESLHSYLLGQIRTNSAGALVFLAMVLATLCFIVIVRSFTQVEKSSMPVTGGGLAGPVDGAPHHGEMKAFQIPASQKCIYGLMESLNSGCLLMSEVLIEDPETLVPICPALIMPESEARLLIPKHAIPQIIAGGDLVIFGLSGNPVLHAYIREGDDHKLLQISMWHDVGTPCASIRLPEQSSMKTSTGCEILGPENALYGNMRSGHGSSFVVSQKGADMMVISGDPEDLHLTIKSVTGMALATVECNSGANGGVEHVVIKVGQGNDVVLMVVCTLAVLLMSDNSRSLSPTN